MKQIKSLFPILIVLLVSCKSDEKQKLLQKENEFLKKELELSKKENELNSQAIFIDTDEKKQIKKIIFKPIEEFLPDSYDIVRTESGRNLVLHDFNGDGLQDAALIIAQSNQNLEEATDVRIAIFKGTPTGKYSKSAMSGNLTSSFFFNNLSNPQISVKKNVISVKHQSMRHDYELKFRYEKAKNDFMLIGSELNNYGNAMLEGAGNISSNFLAKKRITKLNGEENKIEELNDDLIPLSSIKDENIYDIIGNE